jgi:phospholipid-binding lipoprotein MlaA
MSDQTLYVNSRSGLRRIALAAATVAVAGTLSGCATGTNPQDPYEGFNRGVYKFNDTIDRAALKPVATAYKKVTPSFVQTGISNFFGNIADVWSAANNLMQGKGEAGMSDITRVGINSTFGLLGLIDFASPAGLQKHNEDFGQTLGYWGLNPGPFLMLPLLGPSTVRDTVALPVDFSGDLVSYTDSMRWRNTAEVVRLVDKRASLLDASNMLEDAALDPYQFLRDGYLQQRESRVHDGESAPGKGSYDADDAGDVKEAPATAPAPEGNSETPVVPKPSL